MCVVRADVSNTPNNTRYVHITRSIRIITTRPRSKANARTQEVRTLWKFVKRFGLVTVLHRCFPRGIFSPCNRSVVLTIGCSKTGVFDGLFEGVGLSGMAWSSALTGRTNLQ